RLGFITLDQVKTPNSRDARRVKRKPEVAFAGEIGRQAVIFVDDDVIRLLRAAVEREGNQTAFARRFGIQRTRQCDFIRHTAPNRSSRPAIAPRLLARRAGPLFDLQLDSLSRYSY